MRIFINGKQVSKVPQVQAGEKDNKVVLVTSGKCSACGAPLSGDAKCEHCGTINDRPHDIKLCGCAQCEADRERINDEADGQMGIRMLAQMKEIRRNDEIARRNAGLQGNTCNSCNSSVEPNAKFCSNCGAKLS